MQQNLTAREKKIEIEIFGRGEEQRNMTLKKIGGNLLDAYNT